MVQVQLAKKLKGAEQLAEWLGEQEATAAASRNERRAAKCARVRAAAGALSCAAVAAVCLERSSYDVGGQHAADTTLVSHNAGA
jgi:hypothetical protein